MAVQKNPYAKKSSEGPGAGQRVVVAMSGGVDSSVAAALLKKQGFEVIGIALQVTDYSKYRADASGGTCCSLKDMEDARRVAEAIDIPFYVLDTEATFDGAVVEYFVNDYLQGRTPNPCVMCNSKVKFNHLYRKALDLGADFVATGHYAKVSQEPRLGYCLWKARDEQKDQSYFLFNLTQSQLQRTLFPLGNLTKPEVRKMAEDFGLPVAVKPDSQEICFVPGNDYAGFISKRTAESQRSKGYIVTKENKILGEHEGVFRYTIGQRKGLGPALERAKFLELPNADDLYVTKLDPVRNLVVLGPESDLKQWGLVATNLNWIVPPGFRTDKRMQVKIRYRAEAVEAMVEMVGDTAMVKFFEPQRAITPGQAVVFFDGALVLGGGWISEPIHVIEGERPQLSELESPRGSS